MRRRSEVFVLTTLPRTHKNLVSSCLFFFKYRINNRVKSVFGCFRQTSAILPPTCLQDSASCSNHYPDNRLAIATLRTPDARFTSGIKSVYGSLPSRALVQMSPCGNNSVPALRERQKNFTHPSRSKDFIGSGDMYYYSITRCVDISNLSSAEPLFLRRTPSHICLPPPLGKQERSEYCEEQAEA